MALHKYTQEEFDALPENEYGGKICPTGDYTKIRAFPNFSKFGDETKFGDGAKFGDWATFGYGATFGYRATFGNWAKFGDGATFGDWAKFGNWATFGYGATFGYETKFGNWAKFGDGATFGDWAKFGKNCSLEGGRVKNGTFVAVGRIGSKNRTAYFYIDENGTFFVRAGCWFSDEDSFIERVKDVHGGTIYETQYLAALDYAKAVLPGMLKEAKEE